MVSEALLAQAIHTLTQSVAALSRRFPDPKLPGFDMFGPAFRHEQGDAELMAYLKCVRIVSLLNAGILLLNHGFAQELGIICRCINESADDVRFIASPLNETLEATRDQQRLIEDFFREEFEDASNPLGSQIKRDRVSREKVHAGIARVQQTGLNPSDAKTVLDFPHSTYSGYVHGAYPHLMELFDAPISPEGKVDILGGGFRLAGGVQGSRMDFVARAFASCVISGFVTARIVAKLVSDDEIESILVPTGEELFKAAGFAGVGEPNAAIKSLKRGKPISR